GEIPSTARRLGGRAPDARVTHSGEGEPAQLSQPFKQLGGQLKSIYGGLEDGVEYNTRALSQGHQRL
ncbi:nitrate/nitrite two-component system sensor histidine kinase, partial [Pseudomonas aeruginosa]